MRGVVGTGTRRTERDDDGGTAGAGRRAGGGARGEDVRGRRASDGRADRRGGEGRAAGRPPRGRRGRPRVRRGCLDADERTRARPGVLRTSFAIRERQEELARLEARNGGKPINAARGEIELVANVFEYWGGAANKIFGETIPIVPPGIDVTLREPVGVCVLITPWNFPGVIASWKIAPALACGNTAIVKPASQTPLTALAIAEHPARGRACPRARSPSCPGPGSSIAGALIADPRVSKISFTGSTEVGVRVMQAGRRTASAGVARARRQVAERRLRRRRPRRLRREVDLVRVRQRGTGLLRAFAPFVQEGDLRRVRRAASRRDGSRRSWSASRSRSPPRWAR